MGFRACSISCFTVHILDQDVAEIKGRLAFNTAIYVPGGIYELEAPHPKGRVVELAPPTAKGDHRTAPTKKR